MIMIVIRDDIGINAHILINYILTLCLFLQLSAHFTYFNASISSENNRSI